MSVKRLREFEKLEQVILSKVYETVKRTPKDGQWRVFNSRVKFRDRTYDVALDFLLDGLFMRVNELKITFDDGKEKSRIIIPKGVRH